MTPSGHQPKGGNDRAIATPPPTAAPTAIGRRTGVGIVIDGHVVGYRHREPIKAAFDQYLGPMRAGPPIDAPGAG
jgi:hypothetical protein